MNDFRTIASALINRATQANRSLRLKTPLKDPDALLLRSFTFREELGRPFEMQLELQSQHKDLDFNQILGQKVTVTVDLPKSFGNLLAQGQQQSDGKRHINGHVSRLVQKGFNRSDELYNYQATVSPWLWMLSLGSDCRIFQGKTVPDILHYFFSELGFSDFRSALTASYPPRPFCVQYRETALDFVNRIMEQEGIYYFFEHQEDKHTLVLCDSPSAHQPFPGYEKIPWHPANEKVRDEHIHDWRIEQRMQPGACALNDYNYTTPKANLLCTVQAHQEYAHGNWERFDAPGGYFGPEPGDWLARIRMEEFQCRQIRIHGEASALGISTGSKFNLPVFPRSDQAGDYLVTATTLEISSADFVANPAGPAEISHHCTFEALPLKTPFRTTCTTPRPVVHGVQTAVVTGPSGADGQPYPSPLGSVNVRFRWDRNGRDDSTSIWIRVSQISAGNKWGSMFIPRAGNEVIVGFEEGNPDRPVIIGRVYNADQIPPLGLPTNKLKSYITDDGVNALAFDPTPGAQHVLLYSPYNSTKHIVGSGS